METLIPSIVTRRVINTPEETTSPEDPQVSKKWAVVKRTNPLDKHDRWEVMVDVTTEYRGSDERYSESLNLMIEGSEYKRTRRRAILKVATQTPYFTEYVLPLFLASLPVIVLAFRLVKLALSKG